MVKKIVLFSDGTGNSAAKLFKTNVWRTYQALDLSKEDQIALYDNGVGTSSLKALAALGGIFGWGLKRNVLDLYKFLCCNYKPGDEIYAFGFSRGAFTIRLLIGLVANEGLVNGSSEEETEAQARAAYEAYRKRCRTKKHAVSWFLRLFFWLSTVRAWATGIPTYSKERNTQVDSIRFLGLWDTVAAYGMPIESLKKGIDRFIWPLSFLNLKLSAKVLEAYHALALDDERATFHPLVWDECGKPSRQVIQQVWFAGMHSNVGGGYPDDGLAHVPLLWILNHAHRAGLRFKHDIVKTYQCAATPYGKMYDSRAGVSAYYRYAPRRVDAEGYPSPSLIHHSVFLRIANGGDGYAPVALSPNALVVTSGIAATSSVDAPDGSEEYLSFEQFKARGAVQESDDAKLPSPREYDAVFDTVWWRRLSYWAMLLSTFLLGSLPWTSQGFSAINGESRIAELVGGPILRLKEVLPKMVKPWLDRFSERPVLFAIAIAIVAGAYMWGRVLNQRILDRARAAINPKAKTDQEVWKEQSRTRTHFWSAVAFGATLGVFLFTRYQETRSSPAIGAFVSATVNGAYRVFRVFKPTSKGPGLSVAHSVRTSSLALLLYRVASDHVVPFLFAVMLLCGGIYSVWYALKHLGS